MSGLDLRRGSAVFAASAHVYDALVDASPDIDRFCSSTDWVIPAEAAFGDGAEVVSAFVEHDNDHDLRRSGRRVGAAIGLAAAEAHGGVVLRSLDPMWGYACPVVGPDPHLGAAALDALLGHLAPEWTACLISGLRPDGLALSALVARLRGRYRLGLGADVIRRVARLDDGVDGFLTRRSATFRRNARRAARAAEGAGVELQFGRGGGSEVVERAIALEQRSWKGRSGSGLAEPDFAGFYRDLATRLEPDGRLRAGFARQGGRDVGFILGAVRGSAYRGLQLAYDDDRASLSIGNLLQLGQMAELVEEGITVYDLGQEMAYKASWSDEMDVTTTLVVLAR